MRTHSCSSSNSCCCCWELPSYQVTVDACSFRFPAEKSVMLVHHGFLSSLWGSFQTSAKVLRIPLTVATKTLLAKIPRDLQRVHVNLYSVGMDTTVQRTSSLVERTLNILLSVVEVRLMIQIIFYSFSSIS